MQLPMVVPAQSSAFLTTPAACKRNHSGTLALLGSWTRHALAKGCSALARTA